MKDIAESSSSPRPQANKPGLLSSRFTLTLRSYVPKSRRTRRLGYVLVGVVIILLWIGMILAFARFESKSEKVNLVGDSKKYRGRVNSSEDEIVSYRLIARLTTLTSSQWMLEGALRRLDSDAQTLSEYLLLRLRRRRRGDLTTAGSRAMVCLSLFLRERDFYSPHSIGGILS